MIWMGWLWVGLVLIRLLLLFTNVHDVMDVRYVPETWITFVWVVQLVTDRSGSGNPHIEQTSPFGVPDHLDRVLPYARGQKLTRRAA
jgi:hypothetical protein